MDGLKNKRELKEKRKATQEENVRKKAEKRGELKAAEGDIGQSDEDYDYVKDEGDDDRVLGKRTRD